MIPPGVGLPEPPEVAAIGRSGRTAVIQLFLRTAALRVITLVGMVVLARLLLPEDFGVFAVVMFLVSLAAPLGDLGLGATIVQQADRPRDEDLATVFTMHQVAWLFLLVAVWLLAPLIHVVAPEVHPDIEWLIRAAAIALWIGSLKAVPAAMMTRVLRFGPLAMIEVLQQATYFGTALVLALNGAGPWSFVVGLVAQSIVGTLLTIVAWGRLPPIGFDARIARRVLGFGVAFQAANTLGSLRDFSVPIFGGLAGGVAAIGFLQVGQRMGRLVGGIDDVMGRVAFPAFSRLQAEATRLNRALNYGVETTALLLGLMLGWSIAVAPTLIPLVFGERWTPAVPVFQLTAAASLAGVPAQFLRGLAYAAGESRQMLGWTLAAVVAMFVSFAPLLLALGLVGGGLAFVLYAVVLLVGFERSTRHLARFPWLRVLRIYLQAAAAGLSAALTLAILPGVVGLVASGLVFLAVYASLLLVFERDQLRRGWQILVGGTSLEAG